MKVLAAFALVILAVSPARAASASPPPRSGTLTYEGPVSDTARLQGACAMTGLLIADLKKQPPSARGTAAISEALIIQGFVCVRRNSN
jgi:hypothetical protein